MEIPYHTTRSGCGVELNNDVWHVVLDHIVSMSDLKALALTSKALHSLATPRLYHTVCIPLWDEKKVTSFFESVGCGAGVHLGNTRALIFEDDRPPEEPNCSLVGSLAFPQTSSLARPAWSGYQEDFQLITDDDKDRAMTTVVHFFAKTKQLTTFRYISQRSLPDAVSRSLMNIHSQNLETLQCTLAHSSAPFTARSGGQLLLKHSDLTLAHNNASSAFALMAASSVSTLQSLSLVCIQKPPMRQSISTSLVDKSSRPNSVLRSVQLHQLTTLKLRYLDLSYMQPLLCNLVNISSLSSLSIHNCLGTTKFFSISHRANDESLKPLKLKRFALQVPDDLDEVTDHADLIAAGQYIDAIISSTNLESLHLSWDSESHLCAYLDSIRPRAPNLLSYSSHDSLNDPYIDEDIYPIGWEHTLRDKLDSCPKLLALGCKIPERVFSNNQAYLDEPFMNVLRRTPDLRVIHLRQQNYLARGDGSYHAVHAMAMALDCSEAYAFCMQRWASAFFEYLHSRGWCTSLRALIVRCHVVDNTDDEAEEEGPHYLPQCCYVKGFQTDMFGRTGVTAIPVTRSTLRASEPWADIMDFDPECNWGIA